MSSNDNEYQYSFCNTIAVSLLFTCYLHCHLVCFQFWFSRFLMVLVNFGRLIAIWMMPPTIYSAIEIDPAKK